MTSQPKFVGITKITVSTIGLDRPVLQEIIGNAKKATPVCRIVGQATRMKPGQTDLGEYVKFIGLFSAVNYVDGVEYRSGNLILPNVCSGTLEGLLSSAQANAPEESKGVAVMFGYELIVKPDKKAITGYTFSVSSLIAGDDPLAEMLAKLPPIPKTKLLAA